MAKSSGICSSCWSLTGHGSGLRVLCGSEGKEQEEGDASLLFFRREFGDTMDGVSGFPWRGFSGDLWGLGEVWAFFLLVSGLSTSQAKYFLDVM